MSAIEESIRVHAPLRAVYDQWTQFEQFPKFMEGIKEVRQIDDTHLHWVAAFGGQQHEWDAEISEQRPDERVAWKNTDGTDNAGVVTFHRIDDAETQVMVQMDFVPEGIVEKLGNALGVPDRRVRADLSRFKDLIEAPGDTAGGWRGEVKSPSETTTQPQETAMDDQTTHDRNDRSDDAPRTPVQQPDQPEAETGSHNVATPFSSHPKDDSAWGDSDQHSDA